MIILAIPQALAGLYILYIGLVALNRMTLATPCAIRFAYLALAAGAAGAVASCFAARDVFECLFAVGIALYLACNRRGLHGQGHG